MSTPVATESAPKLSPLKQAYLALERARTRIKTLEAGPRDPIAIIGIGCRFPGQVSDTDSFWNLLRNGVDAVTEVPLSRWDNAEHYDPDPEAPRKISTKHGAFIDDVDLFDPEFFGISPREAASIDPQHRLLLETSWEAIEGAGIAPSSLYQSSTGVFLGVCNQDYALLINEARGDIEAYHGTGNSLGAAAGRLSYLLGLQGPSMIIDTACSSSLVALHLACQSLRRRECSLALAGGANLLLAPVTSAIFSKSRMLAPDGRCKAFDGTANGYVRGEGIGVLLLKRLSEALAQDDPIIAVIRGSAVNQDGPSSGLTVPNGPAQQEVIRRALADAQVSADEITYVEAHGTGTSLGDPIEMGALGAVFGPVRTPNDPLYVGSVKTNIGHLEGSAGVASVIIMALMLQHGELPAHLHFHTPSPHIDWSRIPARVVAQRQSWPASRSRLGGVSSFGFSGTNAHVILEAAPRRTAAVGTVIVAGVRNELITLSAKTETGLKSMAKRMGEYLRAHPELSLSDIALTLNAGRSHFSDRLTATADSTAALAELLLDYGCGSAGAGIAVGKATKGPPKIAFLFPSHTENNVGQTTEVYRSQPAFRAAFDECVVAANEFGDISCETLLSPPTGRSHAAADGCRWLATFAFEYALARLWQSWGIEPAFLLGQGIGEYAAASIAGVFSVTDGMKLTAARYRVAEQHRAKFGLLAVYAAESQVAETVRSIGGEAAIVAVNSAEPVLVSVLQASLPRVTDRFVQCGWRTAPAIVEDVIPLPLSDAALSEFRDVAHQIVYAPPKLPLLSTATGKRVGGEIPGTDYWVRRLRQLPRMSEGIKSLIDAGASTLLEMSCRPSPSLFSHRGLSTENNAVAWLPSRRSDSLSWNTLLEMLSDLYLRGAPILWAKVAAGQNARRCRLPTYEFQRERCWFHAPAENHVPRLSLKRTGHPLLGDRLRSAAEEIQFTAEIGPRQPLYLADHRFGGIALAPATAYLETALAAVQQVFPKEDVRWELADLSIERALPLPAAALQTLQTILQPLDEAGSYRVRIFSLQDSPSESDPVWNHHVSAVLRCAATTAPTEVSLDELRKSCSEPVDVVGLYQSFKSVGLEYGPLFKALKSVWRGSNEVLAEIELPGELRDPACPYALHPVVLDGCLQSLAASAELDGAFLPIAMERLTLWERLPDHVWCQVCVRTEPTNDGHRLADYRIFAEDGRLLAAISALRLRRVVRTAPVSGMANQPPKTTARFAASAAAAETARRVHAAVGDERQPLVVRFLQEELASILKRESKGLPSADKTFLELGMDSLMGLEIVYRIQNGLGVMLSEQSLFHFATIDQFAAELNRRLDEKSGEGAQPDRAAGAPLLSDGFSTSPALARDCRWLKIARPNPSAAVRFFCFPSFSRGASLFDTWPESLPEQIELCGVQLPGREERQADPPIVEFSDLIESFSEALVEHLDRPFAFFGHGDGSLLAYESARLIASRYNLTPLFLGVGALWAPQLNRSRSDSLRQQGLSTFWESVPSGASFESAARPAVDYPIIACGGVNDRFVSADDLAVWKDCTSANFEQYLVVGDHESYLDQRESWLKPMIQLMMEALT